LRNERDAPRLADVDLDIRPEAVADLDAHVAFIFADSEAAARRFLQAVHATFARLMEHPLIGRPWPAQRRRLARLRSVQVSGFRNYLVFYEASPDRITIVRVLHGAMDLPAALGKD
jgi:toxin ParE1/3/4